MGLELRTMRLHKRNPRYFATCAEEKRIFVNESGDQFHMSISSKSLELGRCEALFTTLLCTCRILFSMGKRSYIFHMRASHKQRSTAHTPNVEHCCLVYPFPITYYDPLTNSRFCSLPYLSEKPCEAVLR